MYLPFSWAFGGFSVPVASLMQLREDLVQPIEVFCNLSISLHQVELLWCAETDSSDCDSEIEQLQLFSKVFSYNCMCKSP